MGKSVKRVDFLEDVFGNKVVPGDWVICKYKVSKTNHEMFFGQVVECLESGGIKVREKARSMYGTGELVDEINLRYNFIRYGFSPENPNKDKPENYYNTAFGGVVGDLEQYKREYEADMKRRAEHEALIASKQMED